MNARYLGLMLFVGLNISCQRTAPSLVDQTSSLESLSCDAGSPADQASIRGADHAAPGDVLNFRVDGGPKCATGARASWRVIGTDASAAGDSFKVPARRPGSFIITAAVPSKDDLSPRLLTKQVVISEGLTLAGPQVGMTYVENTFSVVVPEGTTVRSIDWTMGETKQTTQGAPVTHAFREAGTFTVSAMVTLGSGQSASVSRSIQIVPVREGYECLNQTVITGATSVVLGSPAQLSLFIPQCLVNTVTHLTWTLGDQSPAAGAQSIAHAYAAEGVYPVSVTIFAGSAALPLATLSTSVTVTAGTPDPTPETPHPDQCPTVGQSERTLGEIYVKETACGVDGRKRDSFRDSIIKTCRWVDGALRWREDARTKTLVHEGECTGQSCAVPDGTPGARAIGGRSYLVDGQSVMLFAQTKPIGACAEVASVRACHNGALGGDAAAVHPTCQSGCVGIGPTGSVLTNQLLGRDSVPKTCAFGESGVLDVFERRGDQTCTDGQMTSGNDHRGALISAGVCPTYHLAGSTNFGACSADCGGTQSQVFACVDAIGGAVDSIRCAGQIAPIVTRVCDGNPAAVARVDVTHETEEAGQSKSCPKNQIGVITQSRENTTARTFACVNHRVDVVDTKVTLGSWVNVEYCRDYVAYRCSQDSLSNDQSSGRFKWMLKCRDQVPAIAEFLNQFESFESGTERKPILAFKNRQVYATFLNRATSPEKTWRAPTSDAATCAVPVTAYIAAVCTASCATPEQQILAEAKATRALAYAPIGTAWAEQLAAVATLGSRGTLDTKTVVKTKVEQWVTELTDGEHQILDFALRSGGTLRLTPNHPVVTDAGEVKLARDFTVGENLVQLGGTLDPIVSITPTIHAGKVYNVFVKTNDPRRNVVVTNGYLNGTAFFQNEGATQLNRRILRRELTRGVFE